MQLKTRSYNGKCYAVLAILTSLSSLLIMYKYTEKTFLRVEKQDKDSFSKPQVTFKTYRVCLQWISLEG